MKLENYELHLPSYSIGNDVYSQIKEICRPYGQKAVIIGGRRGMAAAVPKLEKAAKQAGIELIDHVLYGKDCTFETVDALKENPSFLQADMVFGVGGGKAVDTCKCLCEQTGKPLFTFPTIASNCAACTTVSIMYHEDGTFFRPYFFLKPAVHAFIDTEIIAKAPAEYMWAGIGDTYAKYYEADISSRGEILPHYTAMGVNASRMCLEPLVRFGVQAYHDNQSGKCTPALEQTVLTIIVTTAIASIFLTRDFTPDYNSGLAHAIFYALTSYPVIEEKHLHGEVVGFGVLFALLCDGQKEEFEKIYRLNKALGLPTSLEEIDITEEQFQETMERIPAMSDVAHYPYKITKEMMEKALSDLKNFAVSES